MHVLAAAWRSADFFLVCFSVAVQKYPGESDLNVRVYLCSQFGGQPMKARNSMQQGLETHIQQKEESS